MQQAIDVDIRVQVVSVPCVSWLLPVYNLPPGQRTGMVVGKFETSAGPEFEVSFDNIKGDPIRVEGKYLALA